MLSEREKHSFSDFSSGCETMKENQTGRTTQAEEQEKTPVPVTGVLLAGGRSSRMGRPKHLLLANGIPFWRRALDALKPTDRVAVSVREELPEFKGKLRQWEDLHKDLGPIGALETTLLRAETPLVLIVPCDAPFLTEGFVRALLAAWEEGADCLIVRQRDRLNPLMGVYSKTALPAVQEAAERKECRMTALLSHLKWREFAVPEEFETAVWNINTPEEYEQKILRREESSPEQAKGGKVMLPVYSIVAYSGTGKTTLLEKLIPALKTRGLRLAVMKHDTHDFDIDREGKDSDRLTKAGADMTLLTSPKKAVVMENRPVEPERLLDQVHDVDLILTEGFKFGDWKKILLVRGATGRGPALDPALCCAVVSDVPIETETPVFGLDETERLADGIIGDMKKEAASAGG